MPQTMTVSELELIVRRRRSSPRRSAPRSRRRRSNSTVKISGPRSAARISMSSTSDARLDDLIEVAETFGARPDVAGGGKASLEASIDAGLGGADRR